MPLRPSILILPLFFAATCARGVRPEPPDAAGGSPAGGKTGASSQGDSLPCSGSFFPPEHTDAGDGPPFLPSDVLILFDGSESSGIAYGSGTRASTMADAIKGLVDTYQRRIAFGLLRFPDATSCGAGEASSCCVGVPQVEMGLNQGSAIAASLDNRPTPQGSSPLAAALQIAAGVFNGRQDQGQSRIVLLASDGQPGCGRRTGDASVSSNPCQEVERAVQTLAQLDPPVRTLVFSPGPGDPEGKTDCLRALSQAAANGMQARDASMTSYGFNTGTLDALESLLESTFVPAQMSKPSCVLELGSDPMPNSRFAVYVDGKPIPEDKDYGWWVMREREVHGAPLLARVTLYGEYCTRLRQYRYNTVEVRYDCSIARLEAPKGKGRSRYCRT